jgi:hypothetical protein
MSSLEKQIEKLENELKSGAYTGGRLQAMLVRLRGLKTKLCILADERLEGSICTDPDLGGYGLD